MFWLSPVTLAVRFVFEPGVTEAGGVVAKVTLMPEDGGVMVIEAEALFVLSVTEVATTVTVLPVGTAAGA